VNAPITLAGYIRIAVRLLAMIVTLIICLGIHGLWRLFRLPSPWPRWFLGTIGWIIGARRRVGGARPRRNHVFFMSNHLSWIDILVLAGATGSAFIAKAEARTVPLIGWLCTLNRTIFVARGERMQVGQQITEVRAAIERGWAVTIFPEGTTGDGRELLPFKAALISVLDPPPPDVVVQSVALDYGAATPEIAWLDETGIAYSLRILARRGTFPANLRFADPFDPAAIGDRKAIAAEARRRVEALRAIC
jgi:1-acyl-sn-glycerol-3-phosphate acyltransferase